MPSELECLPKADLMAALASDGWVRLAYTRLLAAKVRNLRASAELRSIRSAPERIVAWLRMRATGNPSAIALDRTWSEVGAELGLTREGHLPGPGPPGA